MSSASASASLGAWVDFERRDAGALGVLLDDFRETLSAVPAPVTIVTTIDRRKPHGTTVSAFTSLSAEPPLVLVALDRSSDLLRLLRRAGRFGVNLLAAGQEELGLACAKKGLDKFACVSWHDDGGLPRIDETAGWLACDVQELLPGGDHIIVVGLVTACETTDAEPLLYHRRRFHSVA
jgi:flavin reductase (DIM6/NTAB) family NADH-FMN oxidoreductase RutF